MLRLARRPRWLGLLAVTLLLVAVFVRLGFWQLAVATDHGPADPHPTTTVVPLTSVLSPHTSFPSDGSGRLVSMTGRYAASGQVLVSGRRLDGASGLWVVTPFTVTEGGTTKGTLAVLRGFVASPSDAPAPPSGSLTLTGSLAPGESPSDASSVPAGQLGSVDLSVLVNQWPGQLYNAFAFLTEERTAAGATVAVPAALHRVPPPPSTPQNGVEWRNAAYAVQWWVFACFALYLYVRTLRDAAALERQTE